MRLIITIEDVDLMAELNQDLPRVPTMDAGNFDNAMASNSQLITRRTQGALSARMAGERPLAFAMVSSLGCWMPPRTCGVGPGRD